MNRLDDPRIGNREGDLSPAALSRKEIPGDPGFPKSKEFGEAAALVRELRKRLYFDSLDQLWRSGVRDDVATTRLRAGRNDQAHTRAFGDPFRTLRGHRPDPSGGEAQRPDGGGGG